MEVYSLCGADWDEDLDCLIDEFDMGETFTYYAGETEKVSHGHFIDGTRVIENMQDRAYDEVGEHADGYLDDLSASHGKELGAVIEKFINSVAKPTKFYSVINIVEREHVRTAEDFDEEWEEEDEEW